MMLWGGPLGDLMPRSKKARGFLPDLARADGGGR
jgi:hypothetical protein